jgi:hypothetical protein
MILVHNHILCKSSDLLFYYILQMPKCHKCKRKKKRGYITRTTKCVGPCIPDTASLFECNAGVSSNTRQDEFGTFNVCNTAGDTFSHLTTGAYKGSSESHLHIDRFGNVYCHSHPGGDISHSHDSEGNDQYIGSVSDCRTVSDHPDTLRRDVIGGTQPSTTNLQTNADDPAYGNGMTTTIAGIRPGHGNMVGGAAQPRQSGCSLTSVSLTSGDSLTTCNLGCAAPGNSSTPHPRMQNAGQKTPDLRGFQNLSTSCITGSLCASRRPTVCKTKVREVYCK